MAISSGPLYTPTPPTVAPQAEDTRNITDWVQRELYKISTSLSAISRLQLVALSAPPKTPRDGLVAMADGTNWKPLRLVTNEVLVTYRSGWVQSDLGKVWVADDSGILSGNATGASLPTIDLVNNTNDAGSSQILSAKSRAGGNSVAADNLFTLVGYGTVSAVHQPSAAMFLIQAAANAGNNIPSKIIWQTSDAAGQLNHSLTFDNLGNLTLAGVINSKTNFVSVDRNGVNQTGLANNTLVKVHFTRKNSDVDGVFDAVTNFRYTPNVAGTYLISTCIQSDPTAGNILDAKAAIFKNGVEILDGSEIVAVTAAGITFWSSVAFGMVAMNGTTDFIEIFAFLQDSGGANWEIQGSPAATFMTAQRIGP